MKSTYGMRNICNICSPQAMGDVISGIGIGTVAADSIGYRTPARYQSKPTCDPASCTFYLNVTMLRVGICYRKSVCLSSVTFLHPTWGIETFGSISSPFCVLAIVWPPCKILRRSSQGTPCIGGIKHKMGAAMSAATWSFILATAARRSAIGYSSVCY